MAMALATTGCVSGAPPARPPSTPYKGDAIWNVSRASTPTGERLLVRDGRPSVEPADPR
jgi:hypothetical protein